MVALSFNIALIVVLGSIYLANFIIVIILAIIATKSDPTDPTVYQQKEAE